jgi:hypothetical protein
MGPALRRCARPRSHLVQEEFMSDSKENPKMGVTLSDGPVRNPDISLIRTERERRTYIKRWVTHTLSRKNFMALPGLFLCFFLVIHLLGTILLFFFAIHLQDFWYQLQFVHVPLDKDGRKDLYTLVVVVIGCF